MKIYAGKLIKRKNKTPFFLIVQGESTQEKPIQARKGKVK